MKTIGLSILTLFTALGGAAQNAVPDNFRATNTLDAMNQGILTDFMIYGIAEKSGEVLGSVYLTDDWKKTYLMLQGAEKIIGTYECRLNLQSNQLEIKDVAAVRAVPGEKVKSFAHLNDQQRAFYVNASAYTVEGKPLSGFLEVLSDGEVPLLKKVNLVVKQPDYKVALDVGSKDVRILKKEVLYVSMNNQLMELKSIRKKEFTNIFGEYSNQVRQFIDEKALQLKKESDVIVLFDYYNGLVKQKKG